VGGDPPACLGTPSGYPRVSVGDAAQPTHQEWVEPIRSVVAAVRGPHGLPAGPKAVGGVCRLMADTARSAAEIVLRLAGAG
jgi:hypothetical protein